MLSFTNTFLPPPPKKNFILCQHLHQILQNWVQNTPSNITKLSTKYQVQYLQSYIQQYPMVNFCKPMPVLMDLTFPPGFSRKDDAENMSWNNF